MEESQQFQLFNTNKLTSSQSSPSNPSSSPAFKFAVSSRHVFPRVAFSDLPETAKSFQAKVEEEEAHNSRLINLKRLLDSYSNSASPSEATFGRQVTLGSGCLSASDCNKVVPNSHCNLDTFTCSCLPYHIEFNSTTCLPRK